MEKIKANPWKNRRLFQIMQIRTKLKEITQIYTRISKKNHYTNCIFSRTHHTTTGYTTKTDLQKLSET